MATFKTVANLDGTLATNIRGGLTFDAAGNLLGTTGGNSGTSNSVGSVFEVAKSATGYAATATTLAVFQGINGRDITAGLLVDGSGNLIGVTANAGHVADGRPDGNGSVFEIAKTGKEYAAPTVLVGFNRADGSDPMTSLIADAAGNLFGTTSSGGAYDMGTVFEIAKTASGYAASPTTLVSFNGADGARPWASLLLDSQGNLFGTAYQGGSRGDGTVFEIANGPSGYAGGLITLSNFNSDQPAGSTSTDDSGRFPASSLVEDAAGDLFGTTSQGGSHDGGTLYEIAKTATGYASKMVLVDLDPATGEGPGNLLIDAAGNLFGTAALSNTSEGTVFEVAHSASGYASMATNLAIFTGANGGAPNNSLIADASGNLYGTTVLGGTGNHGTIFEVSDAGFQPLAISGTVGPQAVTFGGTLAPFSNVTIRDLNPGNSVTVTVTLSAAADGILKNLGGGGHYNARSGVYTDTGTLAQVTTALDGLRFTAASDPSSSGVRTTFTITASDTAGGTAKDATTTVDATNLVTLVGFAEPERSVGPVVADARGDVFGIAVGGSQARVFELVKTSSGFASAPVTVASFGANSGTPSSIVLDKAGDIFGTTMGSGSVNGAVFELARSSNGYASAPKILAEFTQAVGNPGGLAVDAAGNLFGTKSPGTADSSTAVFELAKTNGGYAGAPTTLASFAASNGRGPSQLTVDRAGNLFGTSSSGGDNFAGTIFELAKTGKSYGPVTTLASFDGANGENPKAGVVADAAGDLFGTTPFGGPNGAGEVFELVRTTTGYASDVTILASFGNGTSSEQPNGGVIVDAAGTVFGTTSVGGAYGNGAIFEIAKNGSGYASTPTTLVDFDKADGSYPNTRLVGDAAGNLIGTTAFGGPGGNGTVFELKHAGFKTTNSAGQSVAAPSDVAAGASSTGKTSDVFLLGSGEGGGTPGMAFLAANAGNHATVFDSGSIASAISGAGSFSKLLDSGTMAAGATWGRLAEPRTAYFGGAIFDSITPQPTLFHSASHNLL